jgi:dolichyl-phosphate beta-glucosyltransferase
MTGSASPGGVSLSVIVPAYREQDVIASTLAALRTGLEGVASGDALELIVVDDGSDDATSVRAWPAGADRVITFERNRGKGAAVRAGVLAASGAVIAFIDADLQYPPDRLVAILGRLDERTGAVVGNRGLSGERLARRMGTRVVSQLARRLVLADAGLARDCLEDTQCGLKAFRRDVARDVFSRCRVDRFGFDVEILLLLSLLKVATAVEPVEAIATPRRSSVRMLRDGAGIVRDLLRIRSWHRRGGYAVGMSPDG